jgi:AbiV family abortive infection protein
MKHYKNIMERESYNLCYDNGKKHISLAKKLADENDFGTAITFLVLGMEELIKFLVIQMSSGDERRFTDKEFNKLFSSHTGKHQILKEFLKATKPGFEESFVLSLLNKMEGWPLDDKMKEADNNRFKELGSMLAMEKHLTAEEIDQFILWLDTSADKQKNKGLYVDRTDTSGDFFAAPLGSPKDVTKEEYEMAHKFAESFLKQATFSKDIDITDEEFRDFLNTELE